MKIKDLTEIWHVGSNYAILSLPIVTYSVQPHWKNNFEPNKTNHRFMASYKSTMAVNQTFEYEYTSQEAAILGCEEHLQKLLEYLFIRLDKVIDYGTETV